MAEPHASDPNAAPMHHEIRERFASVHVTIAAALGILAIVAGVLFGILLAND